MQGLLKIIIKQMNLPYILHPELQWRYINIYLAFVSYCYGEYILPFIFRLF